MKTEKSFFTSTSTVVSSCFTLLFELSVIVLGVFILARDPQDLSNVSNLGHIVFALFFFVLPSFCFGLELYCIPSYFSRIHISDEGLRCTVLGKEIKRIAWREVKECVALEPTFAYVGRVFIIYSVRPIETKDRNNNLFFLNGQKNDYFFMPYKNCVLEALPEEYRPALICRLGEELPPPYMRPPFPAPKEKADDVPVS